MKLIKFAWFALLVLVLTVGCKETEDEVMVNQLLLKVDGKAEMSEDDNDAINIKATLAFAPKEDVMVELSLTGNDDKVVTVAPLSLQFKAGEKEKIIKVTSNKQRLVLGQCVMTLNMVKTSDTNVKLVAPETFTIKQSSDIPALTEAQKELLKGYKQNLGIDLLRFIGKKKVEAQVVYNKDDQGQYFQNKAEDKFTGYTIITLSEKATKDKPVLKMTENAMGLNSFFYSLLRRKTVEDKETFLDQPNGQACAKAVKFDKKTDTFSTSLDSIVLNTKDNSVGFLGKAKDMYEDQIVVVPFKYEFSAWDRLQKIAKEGKTAIQIKLSYEDSPRMIQITEDVLTAGGSISPYRWLNHSTIDKDGYGNEPSDWIKSQGKFDVKKGIMTFDFPWDFDEANGYTQIHVKYYL